jgi:hypothetical protein
MTRIVFIVVAYILACLITLGFCQMMASDSPKDSHGIPCSISLECQ